MTGASLANRSDLACRPAALAVWWIPGAILVSTALSNAPYLFVIWPALLLWMAGACLINARRCGRRHCYLTGPFYLLLAAVSLLYGLGALPLGSQGWRTLAAVFLLGTCLLICLPEWIWGRYVPANRSQPSLEERS